MPSSAGDTVSVDFDTGVITDETNGKVFHAEPFPPFIQEIISAGGLMKSIKAKQQYSQALRASSPKGRAFCHLPNVFSSRINNKQYLTRLKSSPFGGAGKAAGFD